MSVLSDEIPGKIFDICLYGYFLKMQRVKSQKFKFLPSIFSVNLHHYKFLATFPGPNVFELTELNLQQPLCKLNAHASLQWLLYTHLVRKFDAEVTEKLQEKKQENIWRNSDLSGSGGFSFIAIVTLLRSNILSLLRSGCSRTCSLQFLDINKWGTSPIGAAHEAENTYRGQSVFDLLRRLEFIKKI